MDKLHQVLQSIQEERTQGTSDFSIEEVEALMSQAIDAAEERRMVLAAEAHRLNGAPSYTTEEVDAKMDVYFKLALAEEEIRQSNVLDAEEDLQALREKCSADVAKDQHD